MKGKRVSFFVEENEYSLSGVVTNDAAKEAGMELAEVTMKEKGGPGAARDVHHVYLFVPWGQVRGLVKMTKLPSPAT